MLNCSSDPNRTSLARLRLRWLLFAGLCALLLAAASMFLQAAWDPAPARRWTVQTGILLAYLLGVFWVGLPANQRQGEVQLLPTLGPGNILTLLRGTLIAGLAGFLFSPRPLGWQAWIPGVLYTAAALMDYLDGWAARAANHATRLGERLDMSLDGVGVFTAALLAVQYGQVPAAFLAVALARYLYLAGLWLWQRAGQPVYPLPPSVSRRAFAGLQMGFLFVILWPLFSPPGTHITAALFALPFLVGFIRDWFIAAGILRPSNRPDPSGQTAGRWQTAGCWQTAKPWLPVLLRLSTTILVIVPLSSARPVPGAWLLAAVEAAVALLLLLGAAGRAAAILGLVLLGVHQMAAPLTPAQILLVACYTALIYLGTGALSVWKPEDLLINRRAGERRTPPSPVAPSNQAVSAVSPAGNLTQGGLQ